MRELYGLEYGLIQAREIPIDYKNKATEWLNPQPADVILEIGSGSGDMVRFLQQYSPNTVGADINNDFLRSERIKSTVAADAVMLPFASGVFDKSLSLHALEHIQDSRRVFLELDRVTKDRGFSFHAFPAEGLRGLGALVEAWQMNHNPIKAFNLARRLHTHLLNPKQVRDLLEGTSWNLIRQERLYLPAEFGFAWLVLLQKQLPQE